MKSGSHEGRRLRPVAAGAALLRRRRSLDPRLRLRGDRQPQRGGRRHRRRPSRRGQRRTGALLATQLRCRGVRGRRRRVPRRRTSYCTSVPAPACAGSRRWACCASTSPIQSSPSTRPAGRSTSTSGRTFEGAAHRGNFAGGAAGAVAARSLAGRCSPRAARAALLALARRWLPAGLTVGEVQRHRRAAAARHATFAIAIRRSAWICASRTRRRDSRRSALLARRLHVEARAGRMACASCSFRRPRRSRRPTAAARDPWVAPLDMQRRRPAACARRTAARRCSRPSWSQPRAWLAAAGSAATSRRAQLELDSPDGQFDAPARVSPPAPRLKQLQAKFRWRAGEHAVGGNAGGHGLRRCAARSTAALDVPVKLKLTGTLAPARDDAADTGART